MALALGEPLGFLARGVEVGAVDDQLGAEGPHRRVLLAAVAVGNDRSPSGSPCSAAAKAMLWP